MNNVPADGGVAPGFNAACHQLMITTTLHSRRPTAGLLILATVTRTCTHSTSTYEYTTALSSVIRALIYYRFTAILSFKIALILD